MGRWTTDRIGECRVELEAGAWDPKIHDFRGRFFKERVSHPSHLSPRSAACLGWKLGVENGDVQNGDLFRIGPYMYTRYVEDNYRTNSRYLYFIQLATRSRVTAWS
jgi:hypothetical protein